MSWSPRRQVTLLNMHILPFVILYRLILFWNAIVYLANTVLLVEVRVFRFEGSDGIITRIIWGQPTVRLEIRSLLLFAVIFDWTMLHESQPVR